MSLNQDIKKELPLWAQLRIDHGFADEDEKIKFETLAQDNLIDRRLDNIQCLSKMPDFWQGAFW
jgi:hypothetical protein